MILTEKKRSLTASFASSVASQVFLHRLNQYAATKMDKNVTEETVKVRVKVEKDTVDLRRKIDSCSIWLLLPENRQTLEEREVGDRGSSCKYNLFISDSGCRVIKVALTAGGSLFLWACLLFKVNTDLRDIYCTSSGLERFHPRCGFIWELCVQMEV